MICEETKQKERQLYVMCSFQPQRSWSWIIDEDDDEFSIRFRRAMTSLYWSLIVCICVQFFTYPLTWAHAVVYLVFTDISVEIQAAFFITEY